ncbi:MAG: TonB-dependent receptor, partial [Burkholderia gladioli]
MNSHNKIPRVTGWGAAALCLSISLASAVPALAQQTVADAPPAASAAAAIASPAGAAASPSTAAAPKAASLKTFVVTGSRIPRTEKEDATPVTVITGKDLETKGYRNVYDALQSQTQNTGF